MKKEWYIPDMYWPEKDQGDYVSHEAICVLNTGDTDCVVNIELYFENSAPIKCEAQICPSRRTAHIRIDRLKTVSGESIPRGAAYAGIVKCSIPVVVQYTRVDTTQANLALMTTMAY